MPHQSMEDPKKVYVQCFRLMTIPPHRASTPANTAGTIAYCGTISEAGELVNPVITRFGPVTINTAAQHSLTPVFRRSDQSMKEIGGR
jgi:hypothetical protein